MRSQSASAFVKIRANVSTVEQVLFKGTNLDFTKVTDQPLSKLFAGVRWIPSVAIVIVRSGTFSVTCVGGIYTGANKSGSQVVPAVQAWTALTGVDKLVNIIMGAQTQVQTSGQVYLSLTTANLAPLKADIFIFGYVLD